MDHRTREATDRAARRSELNRRLRRAFLERAEERSMRVLGRGLTDGELPRVVRWYPGDI